jgi:hypothetical protein
MDTEDKVRDQGRKEYRESVDRRERWVSDEKRENGRKDDRSGRVAGDRSDRPDTEARRDGWDDRRSGRYSRSEERRDERDVRRFDGRDRRDDWGIGRRDDRSYHRKDVNRDRSYERRDDRRDEPREDRRDERRCERDDRRDERRGEREDRRDDERKTANDGKRSDQKENLDERKAEEKRKRPEGKERDDKPRKEPKKGDSKGDSDVIVEETSKAKGSEPTGSKRKDASGSFSEVENPKSMQSHEQGENGKLDVTLMTPDSILNVLLPVDTERVNSRKVNSHSASESASANISFASILPRGPQKPPETPKPEASTESKNGMLIDANSIAHVQAPVAQRRYPSPFCCVSSTLLSINVCLAMSLFSFIS